MWDSHRHPSGSSPPGHIQDQDPGANCGCVASKDQELGGGGHSLIKRAQHSENQVKNKSEYLVSCGGRDRGELLTAHRCRAVSSETSLTRLSEMQM